MGDNVLPHEILARIEALADSDGRHLSVVEWFYFLNGGPAAERDIDELLGHVTSCEECKKTLGEIRGRNGK